MLRRDLLRTAVLGTGVAAADIGATSSSAGATKGATEDASSVEIRRSQTGRVIRWMAARNAYPQPLPQHPRNGEEADFHFLASASKGLPHDDDGEVDPAAYRTLLRALKSGRPADFDKIPLGIEGGRKELGLQGGLAYSLTGPDSHALVVPAAPRVDSPRGAAEMAELYWMALLRDEKPDDYEASPLAAAAAADLSRYSGYCGPKEDGRVTPRALFRGSTPGDLVGPYVSQFLLRDVQYGSSRIPQRRDTVAPGVNFITTFEEFVAIQRGAVRPTTRDFTNTRLTQTGRDLAHFTHFDVLYQPYLYAALIMLGSPAYPTELQDPGNPYFRSTNQTGFPTFGSPHLTALLAEVALAAITHTEFQQFFVHRRLRPELLGGRIDATLERSPGRYDHMVHTDILRSEVLDRARISFGTRLLPQVFPEGAPMSPSYQSGHSTVAGACVTILKAWFNETYVLPDPVVPNVDGTALVPYAGSDRGRITVGGELNKLAANIGAGRAIAGVHYRSDNTAAYELGEAIAVGILREKKPTYNEGAGSFTVTRFDGSVITI